VLPVSSPVTIPVVKELSDVIVDDISVSLTVSVIKKLIISDFFSYIRFSPSPVVGNSVDIVNCSILVCAEGIEVVPVEET
jgi:hypothetical protein